MSGLLRSLFLDPNSKEGLLDEFESCDFYPWQSLKQLGERFPEEAEDLEYQWLHYLTILGMPVPSSLPFEEERVRQAYVGFDKSGLEEAVRSGDIPAHFVRMTRIYFLVTYKLLNDFRLGSCRLSEAELEALDKLRAAWQIASVSEDNKYVEEADRLVDEVLTTGLVKKFLGIMSDFPLA